MHKYYKKFQQKELEEKLRDIRFQFGKTFIFPLFYYFLIEVLNYFEIGTGRANWLFVMFIMLLLSWQFYRKTLILEDELLGKKGEES